MIVLSPHLHFRELLLKTGEFANAGMQIPRMIRGKQAALGIAMPPEQLVTSFGLEL